MNHSRVCGYDSGIRSGRRAARSGGRSSARSALSMAAARLADVDAVEHLVQGDRGTELLADPGGEAWPR